MPDSPPDTPMDVIRALIADSGMGTGTIADQRATMEALLGSGPAPAGVAVEPTTIAGRPAEWLTPDGAGPDRALLYLHGGGYCIGSINTHRDLAGRIAVASGMRVVNLDYRLAPEHPFPAAPDDATAAYRALLAQGLAPERLAIAGDSAGGGLTLATLVALRDAGDPLPATAVLLSPWTDLTATSSTWTTRADVDHLVQREGLDAMAAAYLDGRATTDPGASPRFADLHGLPPLLVQVGDAEVLLDDSVHLRDDAIAAGVPVTLDIWDDMVHVFQAFPPELLPQAGESLATIGAWLIGHTSP